MVGKNNLKHRLEQRGNKVQRFTIKKFSVGAASVAVGTMLFMPNTVSAEEGEIAPAVEIVQEEGTPDSETQADINAAPLQLVEIEAPVVYDVVTRKAPSVEGITPEGAEEIRVYLPGDSVEYRTANILSQNPFTGESAFRLPLPAGYAFEAGQEVRVTAVDADGNESAATTQTVIDSDAISQLTVDSIYPEASTISGAVNPAAESVQVYLPNGAMVSGTVQDDGTWSANLFSNASQLTPGETISVRVRIDGNTHFYNDEFIVVEDESDADIDLDQSQLVVARLGYYGDRYYRATVTLVDELGRPVTGLTQADFNIDTFGGIVNFEADGNVYRLDTAEADELRPAHSLTIEDGVVNVNIEDEREADVDLDQSSLVVARLGYYGDRYYRATVTLVDELGRPVTGLTQEDFNIDTFGGIVNFEADGNVYRLDTAEADELRPAHSLTIEDGVVNVNIVDDREPEVQIEAPEVYDVATRKAPSVEGITPEGAEEIRVYLPGDTQEYRTANILSQNPFTGVSAFRLALPQGYAFEAGQEVRVTAIDADGNESDSTIKTVIDSDAVTQLTVHPIHLGAERISGTVNPEAESVAVYMPDGAMISATVQDDGTWSARTFSNADQLTRGETISIRVRIDGNTHYYNDEFTVVLDVSSLEDLIEEAEAISNDEEEYTEESFGRLQATIAEAREALDTVETEEELADAIDALQAAIDNLVTTEEVALDALLDRIEELENQLDALEEDNEELRAELERLRGVLAALQADQDAAEDRIDELEDRIAELEELIEELANQPTDEWTELERRIEALENLLNDLAEENEDLRVELDRLRAELAALQADHDAAEDRIDELEDRVDELEEQVEALENQPAPVDPEDPADPEDPEDPTDPNDSDADDDENPATDEADDREESNAQELPEAGAATSSASLLTGIVSVLSGLGLMVLPKSKKRK